MSENDPIFLSLNFAGKIIVRILLSMIMLFVVGCNQAPSKETKPGNDNSIQTKTIDYETLKAQRSYKPNVPFPPDIQRIKNRGKLIVAMYHMDRPPFFYTNDQNRLVGIEVEMARDIASWLGVDVQFDRVAGSFDAVVDRVINGNADVAISKLSMTMHRTMRASFTKPYLFFHQALLINRLKLTALKSLKNDATNLELLSSGKKRICVRGPSSWNEYAAVSFPEAEIVSMENIQDIINSVIKGENIAFLYDEFEITKFMSSNPDLNIELQLEIINDRVDPIGMAVSPNDRHLLSWLNAYLEYDAGNLKLQELRQQYGMPVKK